MMEPPPPTGDEQTRWDKQTRWETSRYKGGRPLADSRMGAGARWASFVVRWGEVGWMAMKGGGGMWQMRGRGGEQLEPWRFGEERDSREWGSDVMHAKWWGCCWRML
jgi:hypothetical protein